MRVLLDTHMLLWTLADSPRLSRKARDVLENSDNDCWVSSASVWEITIKTALGKYTLDLSLEQLETAIADAGFQTLNITVPHAVAVANISTPHTDPFDRLLLAQCQVETLRLLTADRVMVKLPVAVGS